MKRVYASVLGPQIAEFITFKRAMGADFTGGEYLLRRFDAYCAETGATMIDRGVCQGFVAAMDGGRIDTARNWTSYLRGFGHWMRRHGDPQAFVLPGHYTPRTARRETYLLTHAEVSAFFQAATGLTGPRPWAWQATAFFGLMHSCGLRTCEARNLGCDDVDLPGLAVMIRDSKGPRTRRLPITQDVAMMLAACDRQNTRLWPGRATLFTTATGRPVNPSTPGVVFKHVWIAAGLTWPATPPFPRPYDLRHRFAYANLERWAAAGLDTTAMLAYLSRYMGHKAPSSTLYYLHVSPDFITSYDTLAHTSAVLLPEVGFDE